MSRKTLSLLKYFLGWPLSVVALFFLIKIVLENSNRISIQSLSLHIPVLGIGVVCFLFFYLLRGYLWKKILEAYGHKVSVKESSYLYASSELKRYIPGNIWGFLARTTAFTQKGIDKKNVLSALFIEAQLIVLSCIILSTFAIPYLVGWFVHSHFSLITLEVFGYIGVLLIVLLFLQYSKIIQYLSHKTTSSKLKQILTASHFIFPSFSLHTNTQLLTISTGMFFLFGLGTYFSIASFTYLSPRLLFQYIGLFNLSLLIGYLTLVTPMGLGVREGVITSFLIKTMPVSIASLSALLSRVILMGSELLFLLLITIWMKLHTKTKEVEKNIITYRFEYTLGLSAMVYSIYFIWASILRYINFYTGRFDLGNMDQVVWNTFRGRIFQLTDPNGTEIISRLAFHADFILILLAPFYYLWADPRTLLIIQTVILAVGSVYVYKLSQAILRNKMVSTILGISYLLNPAVQYTNLYDFHPVTLSTTFLLGAFYYLYKKKYFLFIIFSLLSVITKEQIWLIFSFFGVYILIKNSVNTKKIITKTNILGGVICIVCFSIFYYLISSAIPHARGGDHFALSYYSDFGATPASIIKNIILSPDKTISTLLQSDRITYLLQLFSPFGFLSLFGLPYLLFATPDLLISLLSNNGQLRQIYFQYSASLTPFIIISTIFGIRYFTKIFSNISPLYFGWYILFCTVVSSYLYGPLPGAKNPNIDMFNKPLHNAESIDRFLSKIPKKYSVASTNNVGSHLSRRERIYTIPVGVDKADLVIFLLTDPFAQPSLIAQKEMVENLRNDKNYIEIYREKDFYVFQRKNGIKNNVPNIKHPRFKNLLNIFK